eukprot:359366_1
MPETGKKRKRKESINNSNSTQPKAKKRKTEAIGHCSASISKCKVHRRYLCSDCHSISSKAPNKGLLIKKPEYLPGTEKACIWKDHPKRSIPKHSKRYHGTKSKHSRYWVKNEDTKQHQPSVTKSIKRKAQTNSNSNNNNRNNANNTNKASNASIQNVLSDEAMDITDEQLQQILSYTPTTFVLTLDEEVTLAHVSPLKRALKQSTLNDYKFAGNPPNALQLSDDQTTEVEVFKLDDIHFKKREWSVMNKDGNTYEFGCVICFKFDDKDQTEYAKEEYVLKCVDSDFLNQSQRWRYVYQTHWSHDKRVGHKYAMGRAKKSNFTNDKALRNQIESYLHVLRHHEPDTAYPRNLYLIHRTGLKQIKEQQFVLRG